MELPLTAISISLRLSSPSLCPKRSFDGYCKYRRQFPLKRSQFAGNSKRLRRIKSSFDKRSSSTTPILNREGALDLWEEAEAVEVIGIGSRKDAVLDFCLRSSSISRRLRFWNIIVEETSKVQLQQRLLGDDLKFHFVDISKTFVEESVAMKSHSKAVILVCSWGILWIRS